MTEEEIKRAINNPPYKIAIDNLYKCALEFCKAAKRYLENTDRAKQDELAQISRSKWASFCYSVDILSHWSDTDCEEEIKKELRKIAFCELNSILNEFFLVENS